MQSKLRVRRVLTLLCLNVFLVYAHSAYAVVGRQPIGLPANFDPAQMTLTFPSGTQQPVNPGDQDGPIGVVPISNQPGRANLNINLQGDGLYQVTDTVSGDNIAVIPVFGGQIIEIGDTPTAAAPSNVTVTTKDKDGKPAAAAVSFTAMGGAANQRSNYSGTTGNTLSQLRSARMSGAMLA